VIGSHHVRATAAGQQNNGQKRRHPPQVHAEPAFVLPERLYGASQYPPPRSSPSSRYGCCALRTVRTTRILPIDGDQREDAKQALDGPAGSNRAGPMLRLPVGLRSQKRN
jgi:hypothetical protein